MMRSLNNDVLIVQYHKRVMRQICLLMEPNQCPRVSPSFAGGEVGSDVRDALDCAAYDEALVSVVHGDCREIRVLGHQHEG